MDKSNEKLLIDLKGNIPTIDLIAGGKVREVDILDKLPMEVFDNP